MSAIGNDVDDQPDFSLQRLAICDERICLSIRRIHIDTVQFGIIKVVIIDPVSDCAGPSSFTGALASELVMQDRVIAQTRHKMISLGNDLVNERRIGESGVCDQIMGSPLKFFLIVGQHLDIPVA